jgi:hypothetical protein
MKEILCCLLFTVLLAGCSSGTFKLPKKEYQVRVQVLGVLPIFVDYNSSLDYPEKENLLNLLANSATDKHKILVEQLRKKKGYFDVRPLDVNTELTALSLLSAGSPHDKSGWPQGYAFDAATVAEIARKNVLDAVLVIVFSGEQIKEVRRSRTKLETLETRYSQIVATAAVVDREGSLLWSLAGEDSFKVLTLQYPDFDEAYYNKTDLVQVKNISLSGVEKALDEGSQKDGKPALPEIYKNLFAEIVGGISPSILDPLK